MKYILIFTLLVSMSAQLQAKNKNFKPKYGVCTSVSNDSILNAIGYNYIEEGVRRLLIPSKSDEEFEKNLSKAKKCNLKVYACNGFLPRSLKSTGPDAQHDEILKFATTAFQRAKRAGVKVIVFGSGGSRKVPDGFDPKKAKQQFVSLLKRMGPIAKAHKVTIVLEPLRSKECNFINRVDEGLEIVKEVNHPNILLLADFYHMMQENESAESIVKADKYLAHVHIAENRDRATPGYYKEDFTAYFKALKTIGYKGRVSVEARIKDKSKSGELWQVSYNYMKDQVSKVN